MYDELKGKPSSVHRSSFIVLRGAVAFRPAGGRARARAGRVGRGAALRRGRALRLRAALAGCPARVGRRVRLLLCAAAATTAHGLLPRAAARLLLLLAAALTREVEPDQALELAEERRDDDIARRARKLLDG